MSSTLLREVIARNRAGEAVALTAVCSAHPEVLRASARLALDMDVPLLVEATSNQVNQFGGYTGMQPADFVQFLRGICDEVGLGFDRVILGGDHLGPQVWRAKPAEEAMAHAAKLMQLFVEAGFTKIHLDCSEGCAGEAAQVSDAVSAERSAALMAVCERFAPDPKALCYIVGTEVPPPGGARVEEGEAAIHPTAPQNARATLLAQQQEIEARNSGDGWSRVVALVVQPGLEFSGQDVHAFDSGSADHLSPVLADFPGLAYEAHSTDYQRAEVYPELARRHFAILKVGPALTYAYRRAIYGLDLLADFFDCRPLHLRDQMEQLMLRDPSSWQRHYEGDADQLRLLRHFGFADRIRYYWDHPEAKTAVESLLTYLRPKQVAPQLLSQFFDSVVIERAEGLRSNGLPWTDALVQAQIQEALLPYFDVAPRF